MTALAAASLRLITDAQPQGLANTAWALATSVVRHKPLLDAIAAASLRLMTQFGQQELGNTSWAFAELRVHHVPLMHAISGAALTSIDAHTCAWADGNESARSSYAIAWAQGRLAFANEALQLVARHVAHGQCHGLSYGLVVAEEEWRRLAPPDSALAT